MIRKVDRFSEEDHAQTRALRGYDLVIRKFLQFVTLACLLATASSASAQQVETQSLSLAASDVSLIALFLQAHWVVKSVMMGLLACSVWVWAIAIDKIFLYARTKRAMDRFEQAFWSGQSIEELYRSLSAKPTQSMAACFVAAMREWKRSFESQTRSFAGLQMRIEKVMNVSIAREVERLERRLLVLATVGSAGPFVGLFGTVWGIMSSFQSIAASKNTSLAVVAPGIAEALFATAIGLIAAIPATIFYNKFISEVNRQAQRLEGFADEFSAILSRQIDERAMRERIRDREHCGHPIMAMNMAGSAGGGGRRGRRRAAVMAEINVTPMVDVMLVLLIIFMVAAPLMTSTIDIDLPVASGGKSLASNAPPLTLSVKRTGGACNSNVELYLGDTLIPAAELLPKIKAIRETRSEAESVVYLRGDKDVCYTDMMKLLGYIRTAGFKANIVIIPERGLVTRG